jgi:hypothetical protein
MMSSKTSITVVFKLGVAMLATACAGPAVYSAAPGTDDPGESGYSNPQGTLIQAVSGGLNGFYIDTSGPWLRRGAVLGSAAVSDGALVPSGSRGPMTDVVGATFSATRVDGSTVAMRIARVVAHENPWNGPKPLPGQSDYVIEYSSNGTWMPLCPAEAPGAVPIIGSFGHGPEGRLNGDYDPAPTRLTFACRDGVAAKCQDWGYRSWSPGMAPYFQACTRMARADYCGNGHSRTVDGTMINYLDLRSPPVGPLKARPGFVPEAVWSAGGPSAPAAVLCLSRTRWSTVPLGPRSPCADLMPDPRSASDGKPRGFCDDKTVAEWAAAGALFVNNSRPLDVGLTVWGDGQGHYVTTTKFPWLGAGVDSPSPPRYPVFTSIEGSAYKPDLTPPRDRGIVPLIRYSARAGALTITTTGPAPDGFGDPVREAYVLGPDTTDDLLPSTARALYLYSDGQGHYVTTTDETALSGYSRVRRIGYLPH